MAKAGTDPTRTDDPPKAPSKGWSSIEDEVFPPWRDRLGSSKDAADEVYYLLRDPETHSAKHRVDASGKEIPDTASFLNAGYWQDRRDTLLLVRDPDGGVDTLEIYHDEYIHPAYDLPGGHWKFYVRRRDVERWERLHPKNRTKLGSNYFEQIAAWSAGAAPAGWLVGWNILPTSAFGSGHPGVLNRCPLMIVALRNP